MAKKIKLEGEIKAPKRIKKKVQNTLDNYRLIGEVAGLYVDGLLQTLVNFTDLIDVDFTKNQLEKPDEKE